MRDSASLLRLHGVGWGCNHRRAPLELENPLSSSLTLLLTGYWPGGFSSSHMDLSIGLLTTRVTHSSQVTWLSPDFSSEGFTSREPLQSGKVEGLVTLLSIRQLVSLRVRYERARVRERESKMEIAIIYNLILECLYHHLYCMQSVTLTNPCTVWEGTI